MGIFVGDLAAATTKKELEDLFAVHGKVVDTRILLGYGFVLMDDEQAALTAISELNGHELHGMKIRLEKSEKKPGNSNKSKKNRSNKTESNVSINGRKRRRPRGRCQNIKTPFKSKKSSRYFKPSKNSPG